MAFISYAQHGEDVVLWRALGDRDKVTYVDVGAFDPTEDSVTRALYERGWRGVNVEAQADRLHAFETARPEDVNLAIAVGAEDGTATLTLPDNPGWATIRESGSDVGYDVEPAHVTVPMRTLATLLPELGLEHVDVLKIDVEGAEPDVVRGLLAGTVRPTVCVVEGVSPAFGRRAGDEAVALLVDAGYTHCMFDGLNHYLTTDPELVASLSLPASPVDEFVDARMARLTQEMADLREMTLGPTGEGGAEQGALILLDPSSLERASAPTAVKALYRSILGREADAGGLSAWDAHVARGLPLIDVARRLLASDEGLARPEDQRAEARRFVERWEALRNLTELGAPAGERRTYSPGHVSSEIFVEALFETALHRAPTAEELAEQVAALEAGATRDSLVETFAARPDVRERLRSRRSVLGAGPWAHRDRRDVAGLRSAIAVAEAARVLRLVADYAAVEG